VAASRKGEDEAFRAALDDWRTAPIDERLRAALGFLEVLTLRPEEVNAAGVAALHAAGLSDRAIEEAIAVAMVFNVIDRLADAFDFELPRERDLKLMQRMLLTVGYARVSVAG
jgi:alkylhydroperoxidase family enzyme